MSEVVRLAILADIHGNWPALAAVQVDLERQGVDRVVVAGDSIHCGPFSARVVQHIVAAGWSVIRGNHEFYLLDYGTERAPVAWRDQRQFASLVWLQSQLGPVERRQIADWPDELTLHLPPAPPLRVLHAAPANNRLGLFPTATDAELARHLEGVAEETVITAHIHLPFARRVGRWHLLNPGSVGLPLDGRVGASYLLLDGDRHGWRATFRHVAYPIQPLLDEISRQHYPEHWGVMGHLITREFQSARPMMVPFLEWRARHHPDRVLSAELLAPFEQAAIWDYTHPAYHPANEGLLSGRV